MDANRRATLIKVTRLEGSLCPVCGWRMATDLHEIVSRRRVQGSPEALRLVFESPELCTAVCRKCHPSGNDATNGWLLRRKILRYGEEAVQAALDRVNAYLVDKVTINEFRELLDEP